MSQLDQSKEKIKRLFKNRLNNSGKDKILIVILTGVLLLIITIPTKKRTDTVQKTAVSQTQDTSTTSYEEYLEEKLEDILAKVDGVGKVKVVISFQNTGEKIIAQDENRSSESVKESDSAGGERISSQSTSTSTNIYYDTASGSEPYVKSENMPDVEGVIIVAQGGGDGVIAANITSAVESLLGVPVHKIKVLKMS